jgi:LCP family protein required for cell wall assembly
MRPASGRSAIQRLLIAASALLAVGGLLAVTSVAYGAYRVERVPTEALRDVLTRRPPERGVDARAREDDPVAEPFNVLLVGDSSRAFVESEEDRASFGEDEGRGSDSIVLVRIDPEAGTAATLPFPRDLWVELADGSGAQRINRAYELGGARLLVQTIQERFGVPVHHYVGVDFEGFRELVDAIGGVTISLDAPVRDHNRRTGRNESGLDIPTAGCVTLDGDQALAYVRSRHFERFVFLRWVPDGRNDFGRSVRQQQFLRQVLDQATSDGLLSPARVLDLLAIADENVTFSDDLDADRIAELVGYARRLSPSAYTDYALPVTDLTTSAGALVLEIVPEEAEPVLQVFRGVPPPAEPTEPAVPAEPAEPPVDGSETTVATTPTSTTSTAPLPTVPPPPLC